jgi:hypothetical protein
MTALFHAPPDRIRDMDEENPYSPPEHYAEPPANAVPWTAYVGAAVFMLGGAAMSGFGFWYLLPRTALAGFFWFGVGAIIAGCIVKYSWPSASDDQND